MQEDIWKKALLSPESSVCDAIKVIDKSSLRVALVVDESCHLLGIVTDGDIRRGLLRGIALDSGVHLVINENPKTASMSSSAKERLALMQEYDLISLPIVDVENKVVGLELLPNLQHKKKKGNLVFLMAGGVGQRLLPLTENCPKPLLNVGSKPILESILERFVSYGFENFCVSLHYLPEKIQNYFGVGEKWNVDISYVYEAEPLGTAGALGLLPKDTPDLPIIMMNGDLLTKVNFEHFLDFHSQSSSSITVGVREYSFQVPYGVVNHTNGVITDLEEKPVHQFFVNAGMYVLEPEIYKNIEKGQVLDMPELLRQQVALGKKVTMFPIHEYWLDVGRMHDFETAQQEFQKYFK